MKRKKKNNNKAFNLKTEDCQNKNENAWAWAWTDSLDQKVISRHVEHMK